LLVAMSKGMRAVKFFGPTKSYAIS